MFLQVDFSRQKITKSGYLELSRYFPSHNLTLLFIVIFGFIIFSSMGINGIEKYFLFSILILLLLISIISMGYNEKFLIAEANIIHYRFFSFIPLKSTIYKKHDIKIKLISDNNDKKSLRLSQSSHWLVFSKNEHLFPIAYYKDPPSTAIKQYIQKLTDYGITSDESILRLKFE